MQTDLQNLLLPANEVGTRLLFLHVFVILSKGGVTLFHRHPAPGQRPSPHPGQRLPPPPTPIVQLMAATAARGTHLTGLHTCFT